MKIVGIGKLVNSVKNTGKTMSVTDNIASKTEDLFCNKYWEMAQAKGAIRKTNKESVSLHGYLNGINHYFISGANPKYMNEKFFQTNLTPREMISVTDFEFKKLNPTTEKITAFRCIGEKPKFFSEYKLYKKRSTIKKGDVIDMKEYAYATPDINYAKCYLRNKKGLLYEVDIPENAKVSRTGQEIVFPRSSKFECLGVEHIKDAIRDYIHIKLRYILPDEIWRK